MLFLKYLLLCGGIGMIAVGVAILTRDFYFEMKYRQSLAAGVTPANARPGVHWRNSLALTLLAWGPILLAFSIVVVPSGMGGVRVSSRRLLRDGAGNQRRLAVQSPCSLRSLW